MNLQGSYINPVRWTEADLNLAVSKGMSRHTWDFDRMNSAASFEVTYNL
jgi:hypothetical protein